MKPLTNIDDKNGMQGAISKMCLVVNLGDRIKAGSPEF
jgi:hypothetical protein